MNFSQVHKKSLGLIIYNLLIVTNKTKQTKKKQKHLKNKELNLKKHDNVSRRRVWRPLDNSNIAFDKSSGAVNIGDSNSILS